MDTTNFDDSLQASTIRQKQIEKLEAELRKNPAYVELLELEEQQRNADEALNELFGIE